MYIFAVKNITITLDEDTARWARITAAEREISVSRYVSELVEKDLRHSREYEEGMRRYLLKGPFKELTGPPQRYATREELHDRDTIRREDRSTAHE